MTYGCLYVHPLHMRGRPPFWRSSDCISGQGNLN